MPQGEVRPISAVRTVGIGIHTGVCDAGCRMMPTGQHYSEFR